MEIREHIFRQEDIHRKVTEIVVCSINKVQTLAPFSPSSPREEGLNVGLRKVTEMVGDGVRSYSNITSTSSSDGEYW